HLYIVKRKTLRRTSVTRDNAEDCRERTGNCRDKECSEWGEEGLCLLFGSHIAGSTGPQPRDRAVRGRVFVPPVRRVFRNRPFVVAFGGSELVICRATVFPHVQRAALTGVDV